MTEGSVLFRKLDKKIFIVKYVSHWSSIISEDGTESDTIKLLNEQEQEYVSMIKGITYIMQVD